MSDWDGSDLQVLAPHVEVEASLALFERSRRDRRNRRWALVGVLVLGVGLLVVRSLAGSDAGPVESVLVASSVSSDGTEGIVVQSSGTFPVWVDHREWISVVVVTSSGCRAVAPVDPAVLDGSQLRIRSIGELTAEEIAEVGDLSCMVLLTGREQRTEVAAVRREGLPSELDAVFRSDDASPLRTTVTITDVVPLPTADGSGPGGEVIAVREAPPRRMGEIELIQSSAQLRERWSTLGLGPVQTVPRLDFDRDVVVLLTTSTGACPPVLTGFDAGASGLVARFVPGEGSCGPRLQAHTVAVVLARSELDGVRSIRLPGDEILGIAASALAISG